jgi:hypothetical protein
VVEHARQARLERELGNQTPRWHEEPGAEDKKHFRFRPHRFRNRALVVERRALEMDQVKLDVQALRR